MAYKRISPQPIVEGGTGAQTFTSHGVLLGNGISAITATGAGTTGQVLTGVTGSAPTFQSPAASSISITGDTGGALIGNSFTFTGGTTGLSFGGSGSTETLSGTLSIANGGTNATSMTNTDGVVYYDGTRLVTTAVGTATNVLTSNGAGMAPTFQAVPSSSISITGNTGGALTGTSFTFTGGTTGLSFGGSGTTQTLTFAGITANGGTVSLATDATASTINIATGAGAKTTTLGSTNTTSTTNIKSGSGNIICNSGLTIDSSGRTKNTAQPAYTIAITTDRTSVTGDGTVYQIAFDSKYFDQGTNFTTGSSAHFAVPYTGIYQFTYNVILTGLLVSHTSCVIFLNDSAAGVNFTVTDCNPFGSAISASGTANFAGTFLYNPTSPTNISLKVQVSGGTKAVTVVSSGSGTILGTFFSGFCVC